MLLTPPLPFYRSLISTVSAVPAVPPAINCNNSMSRVTSSLSCRHSTGIHPSAPSNQLLYTSLSPRFSPPSIPSLSPLPLSPPSLTLPHLPVLAPSLTSWPPCPPYLTISRTLPPLSPPSPPYLTLSHTLSPPSLSSIWTGKTPRASTVSAFISTGHKYWIVRHLRYFPKFPHRTCLPVKNFKFIREKVP